MKIVQEFKIGEEAIVLEGLKVIDLCTGDGYAGCTCSKTEDRNRYDKESKTIICKHYTNCLSSLLRKAEYYQIEEMKAYAQLIAIV